MKILKFRKITILSLLLILTACVTPPNKVETDPIKLKALDANVYKYEVFFGLSRPTGKTVSDAEWDAFEADAISPKFYDGYTVYDANGFYEGKTEQSKILTLIVNADDAVASLRKIKEISSAYVIKFDQESVMLTKVPVLGWDFIRRQKEN